jgi:hypothetical protein
MNWKKFILLSCVVPCVFAVSAATAQMRGHAGNTASIGRGSIQRGPMFNSASRDFRNGNFNRFDRFSRFHRFNEFVFFDDFGFPFYPWWGYPYPYGYPYGYGAYPYGYGDAQGGYGVSGSVVVRVQRRLASDGYNPGRIDGMLGSGTRRAIRNYQRDHGLRADGAISRRLLATMGQA